MAEQRTTQVVIQVLIAAPSSGGGARTQIVTAG
jgi:hypothetical protein